MRFPLPLPVFFTTGVAVSAIAISACTTVPDTGRRQLNILPASQEISMGLTEFQKYKQEKRISNDPQMNARLQRVAAQLTRVIPLPDAQWEFVVFEDATPNAFALPGGKVGVHTGLFEITENDAGLAAVVGHEIAHVVARHGGERVSQTTMTGVAGSLLQAGLKGASGITSGQSSAILGAYGAASSLGVILPFSRKQELEADELGALYMARAGYDPHEAVAMWERFAAYKGRAGSGSKPEFLSTHPVDSTRIAKLNEFMPRAMSEYRG
ncbi:MAG: M48 family metallopeptidase [Verrucomicrobiae bacterium]|nr:M48 family metallopeptidase [Verrucomicrobiae bacterium]